MSLHIYILELYGSNLEQVLKMNDSYAFMLYSGELWLNTLK
jgi:hypothetical protein